MHLLRTLQQLSNAFTIKIKIFIRVNKTLQDMAPSPLFSSQAIFTLTYLTLGMLSFSLFPLLPFPGLPVLDSMTLHQNGLSQPPPRLEPPINFHKYLVFFFLRNTYHNCNYQLCNYLLNGYAHKAKIIPKFYLVLFSLQNSAV